MILYTLLITENTTDMPQFKKKVLEYILPPIAVTSTSNYY